MDLSFYFVGKILFLGRLIGHNPTAEERREERELCQRLARRERLSRDELDICVPAAAWAWIGALMTFVATAALSMFVLEDVLDLSGYPRKIFSFGFLCSWGVSLVLGALYYYRDDMLVRSDDESDSAPWVRRIAAKLYYPRAYDFWIALAASIWPALWGANLVP
ncbi:hypothetical protein [Streptomyces sp. NPDC093111]|uniref:hypothetical protein n=1 Tax=Streptomyces sp. NPDC093111 TaxID=3154978 RepID=UPI00342BA85E